MLSIKYGTVGAVGPTGHYYRLPNWKLSHWELKTNLFIDTWNSVCILYINYLYLVTSDWSLVFDIPQVFNFLKVDSDYKHNCVNHFNVMDYLGIIMLVASWNWTRTSYFLVIDILVKLRWATNWAASMKNRKLQENSFNLLSLLSYSG